MFIDIRRGRRETEKEREREREKHCHERETLINRLPYAPIGEMDLQPM